MWAVIINVGGSDGCACSNAELGRVMISIYGKIVFLLFYFT